MPNENPKYEELIDQLIHNQYGLCKYMFPENVLSALANELLARKASAAMHPAKIGKHFQKQENLKVRGDLISWMELNSKVQAEQEFLNIANEFTQYLNRSCFTSINSMEFHYAFYEKGSFYRKHLDRFKSDFGRKFSMVTYLNKNWTADNGGQLKLYLSKETSIEILPEFGTTVFFRSDEMYHEVLPANKNRLSIAGWLKSN